MREFLNYQKLKTPPFYPHSENLLDQEKEGRGVLSLGE